MSFFCGGLKYPLQHFNQTGAQTASSLLTLAVMAILFPAVFVLSGAAAPGNLVDATLGLSRITALIILVVYVCYLIFQLKTHSYLFQDVKIETPVREKKITEGEQKEGEQEGESDDEDEEEENPRLAPWGAIVLLAVVSVLVALLAEYLVESIAAVTVSWNISQTFVGIVLLPIVGNAAEHVTAVSVAMKNKMDLSIGVALGSSIQIALLVIPVLVILGWIIDQPLNLNFQAFETAVLFVSVIIVNGTIMDGESNYLEGLLLIAAYLIIATGFFYHS